MDQLLENPDYKYSSKLDLLFGPVHGMHIIKFNKAFYEIQLIRNKDIRAKVAMSVVRYLKYFLKAIHISGYIAGAAIGNFA